MSSWDDGYFTKSEYTYGYYRDISPAFQRFCLLLNGYLVPESTDDSVHCELGYGQGVSINIHAAATPGRYVGTDFNPDHSAHANELLKASGCDARFYNDSFAEMLERDDMPQFDSISLHGIWSWISPENQRHIVEFARRFLKTGGIFYNSYNCLPGWAPHSPLRELLAMYDQRAHGGGTYQRVEDAFKFAEDVLALEPAYMKRVTGLSEALKHMKQQGHDYLAHEYLNRDWTLMYFTDVASMMEDAKLSFACTTEPTEAAETFIIPPAASDFMKTLDDPVMREQVKDYFLCRQFRKDLYLKGSRRISQIERLQRLSDVRMALLKTEQLPTQFHLPQGTLSFPEAVMKSVNDYLSAEDYRPKSFREFFRQNPWMPANEMVNMFIALIQSGFVAPCQSEASVERVKKRCDALNDYLCERSLWSGDIVTIASPAIGCGLSVGRFEQIFAYMMRRGVRGAQEISIATYQMLSRHGLHIIVDNKPLSEEEHIVQIHQRVQIFLEKMAPVMKALAII